MKRIVLMVVTVLLMSLSVHAWWDTWVRAQKSEPLVKSYNAAEAIRVVCGACSVACASDPTGGQRRRG